MASKENRRAIRKKHDSVLEIYDDSGKLITGVGKLVDVSAVGACFSSTHMLAKGARLHVRIRLLKEGVLYVKCHVVWSRRKVNTILYGIAFDAAQNI